jgi:Fructose-bisphosphate aldolase class-II
MALVSMRELLDHAAEHQYGIPAFNVNNLEQVQAVMSAADEVGAPVILQASAGARKYAGESFIKHLIQAAVEAYPHVPRPWSKPSGLPRRHQLGLLLGDDGRQLRGRWQNHCQL